MRLLMKTVTGLIAATACAALTAGPALARESAPASQGNLALEPIGGYTDLGDVRVITTALCPSSATNLVIRISGGGFKPDSNVIANTVAAGLLRTPDGTGYVVPIFSDWEYLAESHAAKTPLNGPADLTLLCSDADQEHIDARMAGHVRFESHPGEKSTYLQDSGPRIATGIPGVPAPGAGGVPLDAPTAPPPPILQGQPEAGAGPGLGAQAEGGTRQPSPEQAGESDAAVEAESEDPGVQEEAGTSRDDGGQVVATADRSTARGSASLLIAAVAAVIGVGALGLLVYIRRPRPGASRSF